MEAVVIAQLGPHDDFLDERVRGGGGRLRPRRVRLQRHPLRAELPEVQVRRQPGQRPRDVRVVPLVVHREPRREERVRSADERAPRRRLPRRLPPRRMQRLRYDAAVSAASVRDERVPVDALRGRHIRRARRRRRRERRVAHRVARGERRQKRGESLRVVPYKRMSGWSSKASVGVERRRGRGLKARGGRRDTPAKVLKDRRSPRRRGRMGTSV